MPSKKEINPETLEAIKTSRVVKPKPTRPPRATKTRQSAVVLGTKAAARIKTKRLAKDLVGSKISNPLLKVVALAAIGAVASYFINKQ